MLWGPARLGSASVLLILPPLLVAQWAYRQYSEEVKGHERALDVLVAAVEAKAPHLVGHSARVAELSASMAEHLGLRSQMVADARVAGMLHDLGLTTLPTGLVRSTGSSVAPACRATLRAASVCCVGSASCRAPWTPSPTTATL